MNSFNLVYNQLPGTGLPIEVSVTEPQKIFKQVRHAIRPLFPSYQLGYENTEGLEAVRFNRKLGRFGYDWLPLTIKGYKPCRQDIPNDEFIFAQKLIQTTEIASAKSWGGNH